MSDSSSSSGDSSSSNSESNKQQQQNANNAKRNNKAPQELIDEFWAKFTTKKPGKVTTVMPPFNPYTDIVERKSSKPAIASAQASYEEAAATCRAKVEKIVKECRRTNKKYRDPHFDIETDLNCRRKDFLRTLNNDRNVEDEHCNFYPGSAKRIDDIFEEPQFYIDGPTASDVRQGRDGDCWFLSALCTLSNKPGLIERLCVAHDQAVGVYGFVFHRDGEWISEIVDDFLYLIKADYDDVSWDKILFDSVSRDDPEAAYRKLYQSNSVSLLFAQCAHPQETWLPLLEKCYAKAHGDYVCIEGGWEGEAIEDLTGGVTTELWVKDILDKERFWQDLMQANDQFLFGCYSGIWGKGWGERKGIVEGHAYSVQKAVEVEGKRLLKLRNPWGKGEWTGPWSDGSKEWTPEWMQKLDHRFGDDGEFWIEYKDFLRKYDALDRTRLLGAEWRVTQAWTTVAVPWALDYHDTHFTFTLKSSGPVVIVLSQLDTRYFRGLEGQYRYQLGFRVHKAGEPDYIVRSESVIGKFRSINVDLDLEAGDYEVLFKIDAYRDDNVLPIEDVVRNNAKNRRDKLTRIGMAYDLAHSKGKVSETEEEKKAKEERVKQLKKKKMVDIKKTLLEKRDEAFYLAIKDRTRQQRRQARAIARMIKKKEEKKAKKAEKKAAKKAAKEAKKAAKEAELEEEVEELEEEAEEAEEEEPAKDVKKKKDASKAEEPKKAASQAKEGAKDAKKPSKAKKDAEEEGEWEDEDDEDDENDEDYEEEEEEEEDDEEEEEEEEEDDDDDIPDALSDISDLSVLSDRELEIRAEAMFNDADSSSNAGDATAEPDEFEKDPWNAVATISLRVYHKSEGEVKEGENKEDDIVDLKVVRANPYLDLAEEEELKKLSGGSGAEPDCKAKGLDVDDSAKDATLERPLQLRQKSILGGGRTSRVM